MTGGGANLKNQKKLRGFHLVCGLSKPMRHNFHPDDIERSHDINEKTHITENLVMKSINNYSRKQGHFKILLGMHFYQKRHGFFQLIFPWKLQLFSTGFYCFGKCQHFSQTCYNEINKIKVILLKKEQITSVQRPQRSQRLIIISK